MEEKLFAYQEAAGFLKITVESLRVAKCNGKIKDTGKKRGKNVLFTFKEVERYKAEHQGEK